MVVRLADGRMVGGTILGGGRRGVGMRRVSCRRCCPGLRKMSAYVRGRGRDITIRLSGGAWSDG